MASRVTKRAVIRLAMLVLHWCSSEAPITSGAEAEHRDGTARRGLEMRRQWPVGGGHDPDRGLTGDAGPGQAGGAEPMRGQQDADASADYRAGEVDPQQGAKVHLALQRRHDGRAQAA